MWFLFACLLIGGYNRAECYTAAPSSSHSTTEKVASKPDGSNVKYSWASVDYKYHNESKRDHDILAGLLVPDRVTVLDVDAFIDKHGVKREFVTTPSLFPGAPFALNEITKEKSEGDPVLKPFPNEQLNFKGDCENIISAFRIKIDKLGRMWVLDTGKINVFSAPERVCPPKIVVFDLNNNNAVLRKYNIPADQADSRALLVTIQVEVTDEDTWAYACDPVTYTMIVYSFKKNTSHKVGHPYFHPDPLYGFYEINGVNFTLMDGIISMALAPSKNGDCKLYFHSLSSGREGLVKTSILKNATTAMKLATEFRLSDYDKGFHVSVHVITKNGIMIFPSLEDNALFSWNTRTDYSPKNFRQLYKNDKTFQFPTGMKIVGDELYVLTSRLQNHIGGVDIRGQRNSRVLVFKLDKLLSRQQGTFTFST